jgi:hypothetical protein
MFVLVSIGLKDNCGTVLKSALAVGCVVVEAGCAAAQTVTASHSLRNVGF